MQFSDFNLIQSLKKTLEERALVEPTEIQKKSIPNLLSGKSLVGVSETGSGKTLSYVLPILNIVKTLEDGGDPVTEESRPRAAVIVPSRELGEQVAKVFKLFTHTTRLRVRSALGGTTMEVAKKNVSGPFEVLVATPGRLVKLLEHKRIKFDDIRILVFDEADQMLDEGFLPDATTIVHSCPDERQMVLFSATVSEAVQELMNGLFQSAEVVRSEGSHKLVPTLVTKNKTVINGKRIPLLETVLADKVKGGTLLFTNTREQCDRLADYLNKKGVKCAIYRGEMDKVERRNNLKNFRDGKIEILISTDLGSRGLDLEQIGRVINYHMPQHMDNYIHRVGRTARAGKAGLVINFITERDEPLVRKLPGIAPKKTQTSPTRLA